jgi:hypothetical protein
VTGPLIEPALSPDGPVQHDSLERCALRAQLRGDPMMGTAFPASRVLMVEQPGPWGHAGLRQSQFDPDVARRLERELGARNIRVLAIRSPGRARHSATRRWGFADCRPGREKLVWGTFYDDAELLSLDVDADVPSTAVSHGTEDDLPLYLVCAHSKHDLCCAVRGRPVAAALHASRPGRVWECSHVGGERFAANVLVLPVGLLYGRLPPFFANGFAASVERGMVLSSLLRGRVGFPPIEQAAFAFAHILFELAHLGDVEILASKRTSDDRAWVRLRTPDGIMVVTVAIERSQPALLMCDATEEKTVLTYRPIDVRRARA